MKIKGTYGLVDSFQVNNSTVLVLDEEFDLSTNAANVIIDGALYQFQLNSVRNWVIINKPVSVKSKTIDFI